MARQTIERREREKVKSLVDGILNSRYDDSLLEIYEILQDRPSDLNPENTKKLVVELKSVMPNLYFMEDSLKWSLYLSRHSEYAIELIEEAV